MRIFFSRVVTQPHGLCEGKIESINEYSDSELNYDSDETIPELHLDATRQFDIPEGLSTQLRWCTLAAMSRKRRDGATSDDAMAEQGDVAEIQREDGEEVEEEDGEDVATRHGEDGSSEDRKKGVKRKRNADIGSRRPGMPLMGEAEMRSNFLDMQVRGLLCVCRRPAKPRHAHTILR